METMFALTTNDNPFDPFTQFDEWFRFDLEHDYNTCGLLDRIVKIGDDFTEKEKNEEIERAIDEIIKYDFMDLYKKVKKEVSVA